MSLSLIIAILEYPIFIADSLSLVPDVIFQSLREVIAHRYELQHTPSKRCVIDESILNCQGSVGEEIPFTLIWGVISLVDLFFLSLYTVNF